MILPGPVHADAGHLEQPLGVLLDHLEGIFLELAHDPLSQLGTDALDHARAEIALDAGDRGRQGLFADFRLELRAMFGMTVPLSLQAQEFAGRDFGQVAHHRGQAVKAQAGFRHRLHAALVLRTQAQDGISVFGIVERDALDRAGEGVHGVSIPVSLRWSSVASRLDV